jgi:hypothetical protein
MTVSTTLNKIIYPGSGAQTTFSFAFAFPGGTATQEAANILVFFTDALGNITQLVQGLGPTNYQITFNPASGTNPTPIGGVVTYNPNSVPIPLGTSLTIFRSLPLTQSTSLQNQGTLYQPVTEAALDYEMMVSQQVLEVQSRALVVPVSDPTPSAIPAVASRKSLFLAFDSNGNPIAAQPGGASSPVSSVMAPVVAAASLAAAQAALGLGTIATFNPGGAGFATVGNVIFPSFLAVVDAGPHTIAIADHLSKRIMTASVTYTLPLTTTLFDGFGFWIDTNSFTATLAVNGADSFNGMSAGTSLLVGPGQSVYIYTLGTSTWFIDKGVLPGFNVAQNLQLNASVSASALTIALKDRNGNDPSATSPIVTEFSLFGNNVSRAVAGPLSVTVPNGASLGTGNNLTNRIWVGLFDNAGTPILGVYNSLSFPSPNNPSIVSWDETAATTTTAISAGSTAAQNWYTQGGALSSRALRILGFIESTQPTAGAWTVGPTKVQLFGPGIKKPGDTVQELATSISAADTTTSATFVPLTNNRLTITLQSAANIVRIEAQGQLSTSANQSGAVVQLSRGVVASTNMIGSFQKVIDAGVVGGLLQVPCAMLAYDVPNVAGSVTYAVQANVFGGATLTYGGSTIMAAKEIAI